MTNGNDSDLDEYQQRDNLESYRASEFQPPLSDQDVLLVDIFPISHSLVGIPYFIPYSLYTTLLPLGFLALV